MLNAPPPGVRRLLPRWSSLGTRAAIGQHGASPQKWAECTHASTSVITTDSSRGTVAVDGASIACRQGGRLVDDGGGGQGATYRETADGDTVEYGSAVFNSWTSLLRPRHTADGRHDDDNDDRLAASAAIPTPPGPVYQRSQAVPAGLFPYSSLPQQVLRRRWR